VNIPRTGAERARELRRFIRLDIVVTLVSTVFLLVVHVTVSESWYVLLLAGCVAAAAALMAVGLVPLRRGDVHGALLWLAVANWAISIVVVAFAPFGMPIVLVVALLPVALAVTFVDRSTLRHYVIVTVIVATLVVQLGTLQEFTGITDDLPGWVPTLTTLVFTPVMAGLIAVIVYQTIDTLTSALEGAVASRDALARAQARIVTAADESRRRIERDLHDGAQQRLTALAIGLGRRHARAVRDGRPDADELAELREHLADARSELRRLAHGLYPSSLAIQGLEAALRSEADRIDLPVEVTAVLGRAVPEPIQAATYFCCLEAIQNALKHSDASEVRVEVRTTDDGRSLEFRVVDDGTGFDPAGSTLGHGFDNMRDRVGAFGGTIELTSVPGTGTAVRGHVPLDTADVDADNVGRATDRAQNGARPATARPA
jgi:signal transduction histidine kinase